MATMAEIAQSCKYIPANVSVMLTGCHGCGKTEWVENYLGPVIWGIKRVVTWHPAHAADAGDVTGLPEKVKDISGELVTRFCPPEWMKQSEPVVLLIDEANRGLKLVQNAIMQLTCSGTYGNISLPKGSRIVACINPDNYGDYQVGTMDAAQKSRFVWFDFQPAVQETLEYFAKIHLNQRVIDYISDHPIDLDFDHFSPDQKDRMEAIESQAQASHTVAVFPNCRAWERVGHTIDNAEADGALTDPFKRKCLLTAIQGLVGVNIAANFNEYLNRARALSADAVLSSAVFTPDFVDAFKDMDAPAATQFFDGVKIWMKQHADNLTELNAQNFLHILENMKVDIQRSLIQDSILPAQRKGETWVSTLSDLNPDIKLFYVKAIKLAKVSGQVA